MLTIIRGLPGSGKSTLGRRLAAEQNALFICMMIIQWTEENPHE
jgi:adenylate kinase family enzyme